jgi:NADH dehydrogenase [ubiquinone] 1 alpha subcomplex assembly factor 7
MSDIKAIKDHKFVDLFTTPGQSDLSADVDFSLLRQSSSDLVSVHGPMDQGDFLKAMGIQARIGTLLRHANATPSQRKDLSEAYDRLTGTEDGQMGKVYKVLAVSSGSDETPYPFNIMNVKVGEAPQKKKNKKE